jgi:hypothetical protein
VGLGWTLLAASVVAVLIAGLSAGAALAANHHRAAHAGATHKTGAQLKYVVSSIEIHPGGGGVLVSCPSHYYPVGGGYENPENNENPKVRLVASFPYGSGKAPKAWAFNVFSEETGPVTITFYAVCLTGVTLAH